MYVPFLRCESFPYISRRADWFPCALFLFHSAYTPLVFISVPFMSLSVPLCFPFISRCFPVMSTSYFLPSFPCTSLHFPFAPQYFPQKQTQLFQRFRKEDVQKHRVFLGKRRQEAQASKRAGRGNRAWDPCFATPAPRRLRLVERHQIAARYVGDPPDVGRVILYQCRRISTHPRCHGTQLKVLPNPFSPKCILSLISILCWRVTFTGIEQIARRVKLGNLPCTVLFCKYSSLINASMHGNWGNLGTDPMGTIQIVT